MYPNRPVPWPGSVKALRPVFPKILMPIRTAFLLASCTASLSVAAQLWCAPGAVWTYHYQDWGGGPSVDYQVEHRYAGDTLYNGMLAQRIDHVSAGTAFGQTVSGTWTTHEAEADDVVWIWTAGDFGGEPGWDTLYWFGAGIGDRWWPPGHPETCPPYGMLQVMDTSTQVVDGVPLTTLHIDVLSEDGFPSGMPFVVWERIGSVPREPCIFDCNLVIEYFEATFVCYSDDQITTPGDAACGLTLGTTSHAGMTAPIGIYPNPGTAGFTLTGLGGQRATLRVRDMQGRLVQEGVNVNERGVVSTAMLRPGSYLLEIITDGGTRQVLRWMKE